MTYEELCDLCDAVPEPQEPPICTVCVHGYGVFLGTLGALDWFRCAACGCDFNIDPERIRNA